MTTTVVKTIGSGGDYSTLAAWMAACPANLTTVDEIWQGQIKNATDSFSSTTTLLTVSGVTTSATQYVELTTAAGASFRDNANAQTNALRANASNGCIITSTGAYSAGIPVVVAVEFTRFSNLQITATGAAGDVINNNIGSATSTLDVNCCILEGNGTQVANFFGSANTARNSLFVQRGNSKAQIVSIGDGVQLYNCTLVCPSGVTHPINILSGSYAAATIENCAMFGNGAALRTGGTAPTYTTCVTDVASPPSGCTNAAFSTAQFAAIADASRDFRLVSGSAMVNAGTTDSTHAATDIVGTTRPQGSAYDVGCWELVISSSLRQRAFLVGQSVNRASTF